MFSVYERVVHIHATFREYEHVVHILCIWRLLWGNKKVLGDEMQAIEEGKSIFMGENRNKIHAMFRVYEHVVAVAYISVIHSMSPSRLTTG